MDTDDEASPLNPIEADKPLKKTRKRRLFWCFVFTTFLVAFFFCVQINQSLQNTYITPVLDSQGRRIQFRIPHGWHEGTPGGPFQLPPAQTNALKTIFLMPEKPSFELPFGWNRLFWKPEYDAYMIISIWEWTPGSTPQGWSIIERVLSTQRTPFRTLEGIVPAYCDYNLQKHLITEDGHFVVWIDYHRSDEDGFQSSYRSIAKSIQVVH